MNIIIGFSKHKGFAPLSKLIMLCEKTKFSHAYVQISSGSLNRELIYQATGSGVYFVGKQFFDKSNEIIEEYLVTITDEQKVKILQWCIDNSGKSYSVSQIVGLGLIRLFKLFGFKIGNIFANGDKAYVCCELVVAILEHLGIQSPDNLDKIGLIETKDLVSVNFKRI